jgi:anti-anti-sigma factor
MKAMCDAEVRALPGGAVLTLFGDIDGSAADVLTAAYERAVAEHDPAAVVLDFAAVSYINSTGIALIVSVLARARSQRRKVVASCLSGRSGEATTVRADVLMRANDPLYELAMTFGGHRKEDLFWAQTLTSLGARLGADGCHVETTSVCVDPKRQWRHAGNIRHNSMPRSVFQTLAAPFTALAWRPARDG